MYSMKDYTDPKWTIGKQNVYTQKEAHFLGQ
jgi:hypothetical protein